MPSILTIKSTAITLAATLAFSVAMPLASANAGGKNKGDLIAAGVIGLALGAIIADSSSRRHQRADRLYYNQPAYTPPQPVARYNDPYSAPYSEPYPDAGQRYDDYYRDNDASYDRPEPIGQRRDYRRAYQPAPKPRHREPRVITYNEQPSYDTQPWSAGWLSYCRGKFRSFNAKSGTFLGYDGKRHFCVVK